MSWVPPAQHVSQVPFSTAQGTRAVLCRILLRCREHRAWHRYISARYMARVVILQPCTSHGWHTAQTTTCPAVPSTRVSPCTAHSMGTGTACMAHDVGACSECNRGTLPYCTWHYFARHIYDTGVAASSAHGIGADLHSAWHRYCDAQRMGTGAALHS